MPTQLILSYTAYVTVKIPNDIARKMEDGSIEWWSKWGDIYYIDEKGKEQKIDGHEGETDYKRHDDHEWDRVEESDDEEEEKCEGATFTFACSESCECKNKKDNWIHCSKCSNINCDFASDKEEGWTYDDESEKWLCCDCSPEEEEDCLANNPKCVECGLHLSEDDMAEWSKDTTKDHKCEGCLDEDEDEESGDEENEDEEDEDEESEEGEPLVEGVDYEQINSGVVWRESACEGPCHADGRCCYRSYKMAQKIEAYYKKSSAE